MSQQADSTELYIGSGRFYFDRYDNNGNSTKYRFLGNATKCEQSVSTDEKEAWDYTKSPRVKLAQITISQTQTLSVDLQEMNMENIALAVLGTNNVFTQTGGPVTGIVLASATGASATIAAPSLNSVYETGYRQISAVTVKASVNGGATTTLTAGTDYEIENAVEGLVRILPTAPNLPAGVTDITADLTAAAITPTANKKLITAGDTSQIIGRAMFIEDPVAGKARTFRWKRLHWKPSSALALIGDDWGAMSFTAEVLRPLDGSALYTVSTQ